MRYGFLLVSKYFYYQCSKKKHTLKHVHLVFNAPVANWLLLPSIQNQISDKIILPYKTLKHGIAILECSSLHHEMTKINSRGLLLVTFPVGKRLHISFCNLISLCCQCIQTNFRSFLPVLVLHFLSLVIHINSKSGHCKTINSQGKLWWASNTEVKEPVGIIFFFHSTTQRHKPCTDC